MKEFIKTYWWVFAWVFAIICLHFITKPYIVEKPRRLPILSVVSGFKKYTPAYCLLVEYKGKVVEIDCNSYTAVNSKPGDILIINLSDLFLDDAPAFMGFLSFLKYVLIIFGILILIILISIWNDSKLS